MFDGDDLLDGLGDVVAEGLEASVATSSPLASLLWIGILIGVGLLLLWGA